MNVFELRALSLDELVPVVANGDHSAFGELYDRMASRVLGMARRVVVDASIAEEVAQEVFLELWQHAPRYRPDKGGAVGWILTIARQRAIDRVRAEQSARDRMIAIGLRDVPDSFDNVADAADVGERHAVVTQALDGLTALQREAVTLFYSGCTHFEIASRLGIPVGTVKTRVRDGMTRLRTQLVA